MRQSLSSDGKYLKGSWRSDLCGLDFKSIKQKAKAFLWGFNLLVSRKATSVQITKQRFKN